MSDTYDIEPRMRPAPNPSGLGALIANMVRDAAPTYSPETPAPLGTPSGGLPAGAPTGPYTPSGLGATFGNIGSTLADLARGYFAAGQPSVWGQGAQSVDESGMIFPPEPDTTGKGDPQQQQQQPSPMEARPQPEFPPSPVKPRAELPPPTPAPTEKPPEATKAPPRQEPYIRSDRNTRPGAWGRPDLVEQGAMDYPGMLPGPYMPQPHEWRGVMQGSTQFLGSLGSGVIAPLARALGMFAPGYAQAVAAGQTHRAAMAAANFNLYAKQLAQKQAQESRDYGDAFAAYGPHDGKPGDEDALREAILEIAAKNHDDKIPAVLARGGLPAVERLIRERDAHGKDASKVLIQMQRRNAIILQEQRIRANEAKLRAQQESQYPWLIGGGTGGTPTGALAPVGPTGTPGGAGEGDHEFDPHFGGTAAAPATTETPEATPAEEKVDEETPAESAKETPEDEATPPKEETTPPDKEAKREETLPETETPTDPIARAQAAAGGPQPAAAPTRLAARETGTATDAPRPGELPRAETPPAQPERTAAAGAAPAAGTPEAMGATAPVPSLQPRPPTPTGAVPMEQEIPPQAQAQPDTTGQAAAPAYDWKPTRSQAMERAAGMTVDTPRGPMHPNPQLIDTLAQQMVNGTIKIQDLRTYPEWVKGLARARGDEIIADMHKIARDPNIQGKEATFAALDKINPEFSGALRAYVDGRISVPQSAWANPGYKNRTIELGTKADPGFNEFTAKTRAATFRDAGSGQLARNLTAVATAYRHLHHVEELLKQRPEGYLRRLLAGYDTPAWADKLIGMSPQDRQIIGALENAIHTASNEYERALIGGKPTVTGVALERAQLPLVLGSSIAMQANINDKIVMLRDRMRELENQFVAGSGSQPQALIERFRAARQVGESDPDVQGWRGLQQRREDGSVGGGPADAGGVVDYRTYFRR